jgi:hypothetical protein
MAAGVPPPPLDSPSGSYYWLEWYTQLTNAINQVGYPWVNLSFTNSDIADIITRNHNTLQNIQGGTASGTRTPTGNAWHMTGKGFVDAAGTMTGAPATWTCSNTSAGVYTITHNLGKAVPDIAATATSNTTGLVVQWIDMVGLNTIIVHTTTPAGAATNSSFSFTVMT